MTTEYVCLHVHFAGRYVGGGEVRVGWRVYRPTTLGGEVVAEGKKVIQNVSPCPSKLDVALMAMRAPLAILSACGTTCRRVVLHNDSWTAMKIVEEKLLGHRGEYSDGWWAESCLQDICGGVVEAKVNRRTSELFGEFLNDFPIGETAVSQEI